MLVARKGAMKDARRCSRRKKGEMKSVAPAKKKKKRCSATPNLPVVRVCNREMSN